jgi:hypothetical protein
MCCRSSCKPWAESRKAWPRSSGPENLIHSRSVSAGTSADALYLARKYDEALTDLRHTRDMQTDAAAVDVWIVKSCLWKNLPDEAVTADLRVRRNRSGLNAEMQDALRAAYASNGLPGYWTKLREVVLPAYRSRQNYGPYLLAEINTYLDDKDEAFRWLEKAFEVRST